MRDLEDGLRTRPEDPEQVARIGRMAALEGGPMPTFPGSGRNVYIIKYRIKGVDYTSPRAQVSVDTLKVRANSKPSYSEARQMVSETEHRVSPEEVNIESVRTP